MKRQYMKPNMAIVKLQCRKMLTTSSLGISSKPVNPNISDASEFDDFDDFDE